MKKKLFIFVVTLMFLSSNAFCDDNGILYADFLPQQSFVFGQKNSTKMSYLSTGLNIGSQLYTSNGLGFDFHISLGGVYADKINNIPVKDEKYRAKGFSPSYTARLGVAYRYELNDFFELYGVIGPYINGTAYYKYYYADMNFGLNLTVGGRVSKNKLNHFNFGLDIAYDFVGAHGLQENKPEDQFNWGILSQFEIKPFIGYTVNMGLWRQQHLERVRKIREGREHQDKDVVHNRPNDRI